MGRASTPLARRSHGPRIDYAKPPAVALRKPDAEWAAELLAPRAGK